MKLCLLLIVIVVSPSAIQLLQAEELETIVVTGTRMQSLPGKAALQSEDDVRYIAATHPSEQFVRIPGAWISRGGGQEQLTALRSPVWTGPGSCGEVVVAEDGVPIRPSGFCNVNQLMEINTEQSGGMEALSGTQGGAVYGANAIHGVINVLTLPLKASASVRVEGGPDDYGRTEWLQGNQDGYLAVNAAHDGGYQDSSGYDQQKLTWKQRQWVGDTSLTHTLTAMHLDQQSIAYLVGDGAYRDDERQRENTKPDAYRDVDALRYVQAWDWEQGHYAYSVKPYARYSAMDFTQHFNFQEPMEENSQRSAGVQAHMNRLNLSWGEWQSGAEMEWGQGTVKEWQTLPTVGTAVTGTHYDYQVAMQTAAVWQALTWHVREQLDAQAGLRVDRVIYDYDNGTADGVLGRFTRPADRTDSFTLVSPRVGLVYTDQWTNEWYANVSRGHRAPQTAELYRLQGNQQVADIDEVSAVGTELGWRGQARKDSDWQTGWNVTLFSMHKDGVIIRNSRSVLENNAKTEHEGVEIGLQQHLPKAFYLTAAATYAEHRYTSDVFDKSVAVKGNLIDTAPRTLGSVQIGWQPADTRLELEWVHLGDYSLNPENTYTYGGHDLFNFRVNQNVSKQWDVFLRLMNLTNREYAERADVTASGAVQPRYFVGTPRALFIGAEWNY